MYGVLFVVEGASYFTDVRTQILYGDGTQDDLEEAEQCCFWLQSAVEKVAPLCPSVLEVATRAEAVARLANLLAQSGLSDAQRITWLADIYTKEKHRHSGDERLITLAFDKSMVSRMHKIAEKFAESGVGIYVEVFLKAVFTSRRLSRFTLDFKHSMDEVVECLPPKGAIMLSSAATYKRAATVTERLEKHENVAITEATQLLCDMHAACEEIKQHPEYAKWTQSIVDHWKNEAIELLQHSDTTVVDKFIEVHGGIGAHAEKLDFPMEFQFLSSSAKDATRTEIQQAVEAFVVRAPTTLNGLNQVQTKLDSMSWADEGLVDKLRSAALQSNDLQKIAIQAARTLATMLICNTILTSPAESISARCGKAKAYVVGRLNVQIDDLGPLLVKRFNSSIAAGASDGAGAAHAVADPVGPETGTSDGKLKLKKLSLFKKK